MTIKPTVNWPVAVGLLVCVVFVTHHQVAQGDDLEIGVHQDGRYDVIVISPLERLKQSVAAIAGANPGLFDPVDLENFFKDRGTTSATRFMNQRSQNSRRASKLAQNALKWRRSFNLSQLKASQFPCDLFKLGLIFEQGRAHRRSLDGQFVETSPVIWVRLGALGSIVKQLERLTPARLVSYAYNTPRTSFERVHRAIRRAGRRYGQLTRADRRAAKRRRLVKNLSARSNEALTQVLSSIAWWLENWAAQNANTKATMVLDFENTDFAFASWSVGEFFVKLDDMFPDLFEQIIGFRYKAKLWSLHSPISMFNRIFKSRVSSSPETDTKLKFVSREPQISQYMPRVDSQGYEMLPEHVSGTCVAPDEAKAPAGCRESSADSDGLFSSGLWRAIHNEFYYSCRPKARTN